ncbi:LacI family DNA-binding transcriptional regulator [Phytoactinopolyspora halotolerans]|uniref:LacI family transcriptional regulator n=1 Tax=Phytoactinopolyspora halotolerans TaxID=1981512 RepID=A0A6L9S7N8_9ACTN|nr:LacI family DNA-binding transcriptional regulator [Phytoactinopolyspora halotolerans]NEE01027.1 LacI family transcriptional regulator [Phytoactinopolyspora halotolerans]
MARARPTIADVAAHAGVSKGLVSFALNNRPGVAPQTRERILAIAEELGWQPSVRARSLSVARSFALGLVITRDPEIITSDPFYPSFIAGVERELSPAGQALVLSVVSNEREELASYRKLVADGRIDGAFITDLRHDDLRLGLVQELGLPAVTLGRPESRPGVSSIPAVAMEDAAGIEEAVDHLAGLGHRRIAHVAGPARMLHGSHRRQAFDTAMRRAGLEPDLVIETDFKAADGARATRHLLAGPDRPTAIVYANDPMAIAGLGVAQHAGLNVPGDLSITGFDGTDIGEHVYPALSTIVADPVRWGSAAARVLLRMIAGDPTEDVDLPPARFVRRKSSGPAPRTP